MELSLTSQLFCPAESSRHHRRLQDEVPILIPEGLHLPSFAAGHLPDVDPHPEATVDRREPISTHTDHGLCQGHDHLDNIEAPTGAAQDLTHLDPDPHQGDVEAEDGIALDGMAQDGEAQVTAVIAAMTIEAEAEVAEEEAEDGVDTVEWVSHQTALGEMDLRVHLIGVQMGQFGGDGGIIVGRHMFRQLVL
jgi:hypothetical protein